MTIDIGPSTPTTSQTTSGSRPLSVSTQKVEQGDSTTSTSGLSSQLSTLAQQLSDSALRAEERDNALSRKELGARAEELLDEPAGSPIY